jgi:hypothetical protein
MVVADAAVNSHRLVLVPLVRVAIKVDSVDRVWARRVSPHAASEILSAYSSSMIASCNAGLTWAMALLSGLGCTRFVSSTT